MLVLCYYALFEMVSLTYFFLESPQQDDQFLAIQQYFNCEAVRSVMECYCSSFDNFGYHWFVMLVYVLLGLVPAVGLTFVINWTAAKELCKHLWMNHFKIILSAQASMANHNQAINTVEMGVY